MSRLTADEFEVKFQDSISRIPALNYLIEITKCCGYSEILPFYRHYTLNEFYTNVKYQFGYLPGDQCPQFDLYVLDENGQRVYIPIDNEMTLKEYILQNQRLITPIYPLPAKVVYRVYLDDGHVHECM